MGKTCGDHGGQVPGAPPCGAGCDGRNCTGSSSVQSESGQSELECHPFYDLDDEDYDYHIAFVARFNLLVAKCLTMAAAPSNL